MDISDLFIGMANLLSGVKSLKSGFESIGGALSGVKITSEGTGATLSEHKVGSSIEDRIKHIRDMVQKGKLDPKVRAFTVKVVSVKCAKCPSCGTKNALGWPGDRVRFGLNDSVRGTLKEDSWVCGKCASRNSLDLTTWCVPEKNWKREVVSVFEAVRANIRYVRDIANVDTYQHPKRTLEWGGGDCDCYTIALCSMLLSIGYPVKLRVMETKHPTTGRRAGTWNHILMLVGLPPRGPTSWLPLDASLDKNPGWYPPKSMIYRVKDFPI